MADRYYLESPPEHGKATLSGPEAHHLIHVMRCQPGDAVVLFDGSGGEFTAEVQKAGRAEVQCRVIARAEIDRELGRRIVLAVALPKGDRQRWLVEKSVELGVAALVPLETERGVAQPVENALGRLRRAVVEASKQCGRNRLMEIAEPRSWPEFAQSEAASAVRLLAHPGGASADSALRLIRDKPAADRVIFAVGPEGGFTSVEVAMALAHHWQSIDLGSRILRVETAALALAAAAALLD